MTIQSSALKLVAPVSLRTIRKLRAFTLKQLEAKSGVNVSVLSMAETGRMLLDDRQLTAIATTLGVDAGLLLTDPDEIVRRASVIPRKGAAR